MPHTLQWYGMLRGAMEEDGENFDERICTLDEDGLRQPFVYCDAPAFTAWGRKWVYFPVCFDNQVWVGHAPRDPCDLAMDPQGG